MFMTIVSHGGELQVKCKQNILFESSFGVIGRQVVNCSARDLNQLGSCADGRFRLYLLY